LPGLLKLLVTPVVAVALAGAASASSSSVWISNCGHLVQKPATFTLACADANYRLTALRWLSWGKSTANGTGKAVANDCTPTCVAGHFHSYAVAVTAARPIMCGTARRYARLTILYSGTRPAGYGKTDVHTFTCKY
jgi:hypothetical protein